MDTSLTLKPIELIDIGIDKLTKIPIPILSDNMISIYNIDESGIPIDSLSFIINTSLSINGLSGSCTINSVYPITLTFNWGNNRFNQVNISGNTTIDENSGFYYDSNGTYTILITGGVSLITNFEMINQGITSILPYNLKKLTFFNLSGNSLTTINMDGLIYLKYIYLQYNKIIDVDFDIYIAADTFLSFNGYINTVGNSSPTIYSEIDRNNLISKGWTLTY